MCDTRISSVLFSHICLPCSCVRSFWFVCLFFVDFFTFPYAQKTMEAGIFFCHKEPSGQMKPFARCRTAHINSKVDEKPLPSGPADALRNGAVLGA